MEGMTRRDFSILGAAAGMAALGTAGIASAYEAPANNQAVILPSGMEESRRVMDSGTTVTPQDAPQAILDVFTAEDIAASEFEMDPITDFAEERTYDVVVVGAGVAGVPAVMTALEEGATVACLQKLGVGSANGSGESGIVVEESGELGITNWLMMYGETCSYRNDPALTRFYAMHSGEAVRWLAMKSAEAGVPATGHGTTKVELEDGSTIYKISTMIMPNDAGYSVMIDKAIAEGAEFFFETPGVQLIQDESGRVTGVVGKTAEGTYIRFNAEKAVIIAAGDYENNDPMVAHFMPDILDFKRVQVRRTGDGILMAAKAGGHMTLGIHPCQLHDMHSDPRGGLRNMPFLGLNMAGERFMNEAIGLTNWWQQLRFQKGDWYRGNFVRIFDSTYPEQLAEWNPGAAVPTDEDMVPFMPLGDDYNGNGGMYRADTLEELAGQLGMDADAIKASVERYNEMVAAGADTDFGKPARYLSAVAQPPFYACVQEITCCAIDAGIAVNENYQVVDANDQPIPGLFSVGSGAGCICGDVNWPLEYTGGSVPEHYKKEIFGAVSNGHCVTAGRYATLYALTGSYEPSNPCEWTEAVKAYYDGGDLPW